MTQRYLPAPPAIRPLYEGGPDISPVAWGMWRFDGSDVAAAQHRVETALAAGITLFDTADIYGLGGPGGFGGPCSGRGQRGIDPWSRVLGGLLSGMAWGILTSKTEAR